MRRLNVREAQIDACIQRSLFALPNKPQSPPLERGELLLLQLVKSDALRLGLTNARINYAIVFDRLERDYDGTLSREFWPNEGRTWNWIVYGSASVPTVPFSLDRLRLSRSYSGQDTQRFIEPADEELISPYIQWALASTPQPNLQITPPSSIADKFGREPVLSAIFNHDHLELLNPVPAHKIITTRYERNPLLGETLKSYYGHRCQVCGREFRNTYDVDYAEAHHIHRLSDGGPDVSGNIVVLCPNHHRVVHAAGARFDSGAMTFDFPNGLRESLLLPDHLQRSRDRNIWPRAFEQPQLKLVAESSEQYHSDGF